MRTGTIPGAIPLIAAVALFVMGATGSCEDSSQPTKFGRMEGTVRSDDSVYLEGVTLQLDRTQWVDTGLPPGGIIGGAGYALVERKKTVTDSRGAFAFEALGTDAGEWEIRVTGGIPAGYDGFGPMTVQIPPGDTGYLQIVLRKLDAGG